HRPATGTPSTILNGLSSVLRSKAVGTRKLSLSDRTQIVFVDTPSAPNLPPSSSSSTTFISRRDF
ncbi:hypothetical protein CF336_g6918, partial [Tilletia laevis]